MRFGQVAFSSVLGWFCAVATTAHVAFAEPQSTAVFRDDFVGASLNPAWQVVNPDKDRATLIDNEYLMIFTYKQGTNVFQYNGPLPEDYEVLLKIHTPPQNHNQVVRLLLRRDDDNFIRIGFAIDINQTFGSDQSEVFLAKTLRGETSKLSKRLDRLPNGKELYLRLVKRGVEYSGAYSADGSQWVEVGTQPFLNLGGKPAIDAYYVVEGSNTPPESGLRFDFFEIRGVGTASTAGGPD